MRIIYPYNEILPVQKAHDSYLFTSCVYLAQKADVTLLTGKGTSCLTALYKHYKTEPAPKLTLKTLPLIRKNNLLGISYNRPFFYFCQKEIEKVRPNYVLLSVLKQGAYHLKRKVPGCSYIYEVHELAYYPKHSYTKNFYLEKEMLQRADLVVVTTKALKEILQAAPYNLKTPIEILGLATSKKRLPPPTKKEQLHLFYVGALYEGQGIGLLLKALAKTEGVQLTVVGGKTEEIAHYQKMCGALGISNRITFLGFIAPSKLDGIVAKADLFVAPFEACGRHAYVAHTKLLEYQAWGRPLLAPNLPIVQEMCNKGALFFTPGCVNSLAQAITNYKERATVDQEAAPLPPPTWHERTERYHKLLPYSGVMTFW